MAVVGAIGAVGTFILGTAWEIIAEKTLEGLGKKIAGEEDTEELIRQQIMEKTYQTRESLLTMQQQELKTAYTFLENGYVLYFADPLASRKDFAKAREFATSSFEALEGTADKIRALKVSIISSMHEFDGNLEATYRLCTNYLRKMNYMPQTREAVRIHLGLEPGLELSGEELEENKLTIKKVMDINKCVAAFLAEQEPNEKQLLQNWPVIEYLPGKKIHPVTEFHLLQGLVKSSAHCSTVTSIILADDILVTGTAQEGIRVWHPATLTLLASGRLDNEMKVFSLAVYRDRIFSGLEDGSIVIWNLDVDFNLTKELTLNAHESTVWSLIIEGDILYSGSQDKCVTVWELNTGEDEHRFADEQCEWSPECSETIHLPHWIQTLKFYKNSLLLARGDDKISFINGVTGEVSTEEGFGAGDAITLNDNYLFTSRGNKIDVFRIHYPLDGGLRKDFLMTLDFHVKRVVKLTLVGDFIVSAGYDGFLRVFDIESFKCRSTVDVGHCGIWSMVADKQGGTQFVNNVYAGCKDGALFCVPLGRKATSFSHKFSRLSSLTAEKRRPSVSLLSPSILEKGGHLAVGGPGTDATYLHNYQPNQMPATPCIASMAPTSMAKQTASASANEAPLFSLNLPKKQPTGPDIRPHKSLSTKKPQIERLAIAAPAPASVAAAPATPLPAPAPPLAPLTPGLTPPTIVTVPPTPPVTCTCLREHLPTCPMRQGGAAGAAVAAGSAAVAAPSSPSEKPLRLPPAKDPRGAPRPETVAGKEGAKESGAIKMLETFLKNPEMRSDDKDGSPKPGSKKAETKPKEKEKKKGFFGK